MNMICEAEREICKIYLEDLADLNKSHSCNEYKLLMAMLDTEPCEDTISRQVAIDAIVSKTNSYSEKELRAYAIKHSLENGWTGGIIDAMDAVINVPSAQPEQKWIPCSEGLPDNRVDVLICYRVWQQYAKRYVYTIVNGWYARKYSVNENVFSEWEADCDYKEDEDEFYIQEGWYEFTTQGNGDLMNWYIGGAEVVAWMPLPEPYQEGSHVYPRVTLDAERRTDPYS